MGGTNRLRRVAVAVAILTVGALSAACSSGSSSSSTTATTVKATGTPITVGVICSCSGAFGAYLSGAEQAYVAWSKSVNASGGLNGHPLELTVANDQLNPSTASTEVQSMISAHVDAIADFSFLDEVFAPAVAAAKIPVVGANMTEVPFYTNPYFFPEGQTNDSGNYSVAATAKAAGGKNIGVFYCAEASTCAAGVPLLKTAGTEVGIPLVYSAEVAATAPNYTAQCVAAQQQKVQAIFFGLAGTTIQRVAPDCAQQSYSPIYVSEGEGYTLPMATTTGLNNNLRSSFGTLPLFASNPQITAMNSAVNKYYPGLTTDSNHWSQFGQEAWTSGLLLAAAIKGANVSSSTAVTPALIEKGLYTLKADNLGGMTVPLTFKQGEPHPIDCWYTTQIKNKVPTLLNGGKISCEPAADQTKS
jgi:branched-chain amino acid transport system substrate-binding protein